MAKTFRMKGESSSPLDMAEERRSWSSLSPDSPFSAEVGTIFRRDLEEFIGFVFSDGGVTVTESLTEPLETEEIWKGKKIIGVAESLFGTVQAKLSV